ncbi:unnamed protein product [Adineta steineri]|uniref:Uncharacterized protein n=1 Tax=Adineta steineri TaxID=433720 RepID=A0A820CR50_9BILA|nr:unnamed protein product [Adineta steineri]CAF0771343.1 unnamed protein product [Adineta steineri]CAF3548714.1 unnamed protein product [Adineta steineri]CAF4211148.1 unnamed protein product [Adineta steineri]
MSINITIIPENILIGNVIQAIFYVFWTVLYKYKYLLTIKYHAYLILFQILIPLSSLITTNITFRQFKLCFVAFIYIIPTLTIIILYIIIYYDVRNSSLHTRQSSRSRKRDAELDRNIFILFSIFLFDGIPLSLYVIVSSKIESLPTAFYLFLLMIPTMSVTIILNKRNSKCS